MSHPRDDISTYGWFIIIQVLNLWVSEWNEMFSLISGLNANGQKIFFLIFFFTYNKSIIQLEMKALPSKKI